MAFAWSGQPGATRSGSILEVATKLHAMRSSGNGSERTLAQACGASAGGFCFAWEAGVGEATVLLTSGGAETNCRRGCEGIDGRLAASSAGCSAVGHQSG